jgi:hypothetical protein
MAGPDRRCHLSRRVLRGDALTAFESAAANRGNTMIEHLSQVLNDVTDHISPKTLVQCRSVGCEALFTSPVIGLCEHVVVPIIEINDQIPACA